MVKEKLADIGLTFIIESVLSDFEFNIMKAVDQIMPGVIIMGCFFHFKKALQNKVDKKGMKTVYEHYKKFRNFINECGALSHLPVEDLESIMEYVIVSQILYVCIFTDPQYHTSFVTLPSLNNTTY